MKFTRFQISASSKDLRKMIGSGYFTLTNYQESRQRTEKSWEVCDKWKASRCPFYRCYPGYIETVRKIDFSKFEWDSTLPLDPVAIELPETVEYFSENLARAGEAMDIPITTIEQLRVHGALLFRENDTISAILYGYADLGRETNSILTDILTSADGKHLNLLGAIAIGLQLVKDEPDLFKPILLRRDDGKEARPELVQRAIRNGVYGFAVGEALPTKEEIEQMKKSGTFHEGEKSPHFRSSYFGLRWTGKNRATPKFVRIKECIVGMKKILKVPTGYYEKEDSSGKN